MSLPVPRNSSANTGLAPFEPRLVDADLGLGQVIAGLRRRKWLIVSSALLGLGGGIYYSWKADRIYRADVTLQIEEKKPNLPDVFSTLSQTNDVGTDIEVLGSRTLVEEATKILGLQVRLITPSGMARDTLLGDIQATPGAKRSEYLLKRQSDGSFEVRDNAGTRLARTRPGERLLLPGVTLRLRPEANRFPELRLRVLSFTDAVASVGKVNVERAGREANIIALEYESRDPGLVWKIPNLIAERFIERRQQAQKAASRSQAKFLREQIDTLSGQLARAENQLKVFRERARVVDPAVEASSQINRLVNIQAERSSLEAERSALASLLEDVQSRQKQDVAGKPSVYRELLAFPSLLRNQAASQLLSSLAQVEDQRATLLTRRTEADPDVQFLSRRITELENQLSTMAIAYLKGLSNQVSSLDAAIATFGGQLSTMPRKELEFARLQRQPLVLKEMYTLLQTRLKEAEIAEAAENSTVSIVDPAIPPRRPVRPRVTLILISGFLGGVLLGIGLTMLLERTDRSIKTRSDAVLASGLPVMAIVPRIRRGSRGAIMAKRSKAAHPKISAAAQNGERPATTGGYTFLSSSSPQENTPAPKTIVEAPKMVSRHAPSRMSLSRAAGAVAEAYAILQTNITFSRPEEHIKVLVLTSPLPGEGKTTTAVNLALTLCQRGLSVCLVDADLRRPQLHEVFHIAQEPGLADVLRGLQTFEGAYRPVQIDEGHGIVVLTAGSQGGSAPALVGSTRMRALLGELRDMFDLVILDSPPVNLLTDAALLGVNADGVIVVVRAGSTDAAALEYAMEQLNHVRAPTLGIVLNDVDLKQYGAYDGAYKYYSYGPYATAQPGKAETPSR